MKTRMDKTGRLVIPKQIREEAGLTPGIELDVDYRDGLVVIEPVYKVQLVRKGTFLTSRVPGARKLTVAEVNRWIRRSRERKL